MTLHVSETVVVHDQDIQTRFVRAEGTSGNNRHHKAVAVEVRYDILRAPLQNDVKARLMRLGGRHVTSSGVLIITSRLAASQKTNRDAALGRLLSLLLRASRPVTPRKPTRPRTAVRAKRLESKRTHGRVKMLRHGDPQSEDGRRS